MKNLLSVEISRFTSRRAVRVFLGGAILGLVGAGALTFAFSSRDVAGATQRARAQAVREYEACLRGEFAPPPEELPPGFDPKEACQTTDPSQITADPRFHLKSLRDVLAGASGPLVLVGLILGASFVGAEWHHRTMTTLLTWEPRRVRVALAKFAACAAVVTLAVAAYQALLGGVLVPAAVFRGTTAGTSASWLGGVVGVGLRGALMAGLASVLGGAVALVARNSAFAMGVWFAWLAVLEGIIRGVKPAWTRWLIGDNAASLVAGTGEGPRTTYGAGILLALYVVAAAALATASFRSRDVA